MTSVIISEINQSYIHIESEPGILKELQDHFTFFVESAFFHPKFKMGLWDGHRLFSLNTQNIYRGFLQNIQEFCRSRNYNCIIPDSLILCNELSVHEANIFIDSLKIDKLIPREYQIDSFVHIIRNKRHIILSPTSSGKSLLLYITIRKLLQGGAKILIIVPTTHLVEQLYKDFGRYALNSGWSTEDNVHRIYSGMDKTTKKPIIISTWQSAITIKDKEWFEQFDAIIVDEAHLAEAKCLTTILERLVNAEYRIGLTGTLKDTKTNKITLEGLFGPVRVAITTKELIDSGFAATMNIKAIILKHDKRICRYFSKIRDYTDEISYIIKCENRNRFIENLVLSLKGNTMVLFNRIEHGKQLYNNILKAVGGKRKVYLVYGEVNTQKREMYRELVDLDKDAILVASTTFMTGVNIENIHYIIMCHPYKSNVRNQQSIGRGLRLGSIKSNLTFYDIVDDFRVDETTKMNILLSQFVVRVKIYNDESFPYKIYHVKLTGGLNEG